MKSSGLKIIPAFFAMLITLPVDGAVFYVNQNAAAGGNGISWATAFRDLPNALSGAISGDEIWVAAGIYKPTTTTTRTHTFFMKNGVNLYGGFIGTETAISQRNIGSAPTTLSGDIGQVGSLSDNSYTVVYAEGLTSTITIDGFRIIDGNNTNSRGGGLWVRDSPNGLVILNNCTVYNNWAYSYGGGIEVEGSNLRVSNCSLLSNNCDRYGGGAIAVTTSFNSGYAGSIAVLNTLISGNTAISGPAVYFIGKGDFYMDRCMVTNNTGQDDIIYAEGYTGNAQFYNSTIVGNEVSYTFGSTIFIDIWGVFDTCTFTNLTIAHNKNSYVSTSEGALNLQQSYHKVNNCIVYGNTPSTSGMQVTDGVVTNSIIEGGFTGGVNVSSANPQFSNPGTLAWAPFDATAYDYTCLLISPAIDAGDNAFLDMTYFYLDLAGADRIHGSTVDIGAYENIYCLLNTTISTSSDSVLCAGESVTLTATGGGTSYTWSGGQTQQAITVSASGNYKVTVSDTVSSCLGFAGITISVLNAAVNITGDLNKCIGEITTLSATGNNQLFQWNTGDTVISISVATGGIYSVTATNAGGCTSTDQVNVIFNPNPVPGISFTEQSGVAANDGIACAGDVVNLTATGGTSYIWSTGVSGASIAPRPTNATSYFAQVINSSGCFAYSDTVSIFILPNPSVTITGSAKRCEGQTAVLTATGNSSVYSWSTGATLNNITVNSTGTYSVTADNGGGCSVTDSHSIDISSPHPVISISEQSGSRNNDGIICEGYQVTLTATGGNTYHWSNNSSTAAIQVTPASNTDYIVTAIDAGGCTGKDTATIEVHPNPVVTFSIQDSFPANSPAVELSSYASPTGGAFGGNNGVSGSYFFPANLFPGQYNINYTYTDTNGCSNSANQTVVVYLNTSISSNSITHIKIFPNPATTELTIISGEKGFQQYCLSDLLGKEIYTGRFITELKLDVSSLSIGSYLLNVEGMTWLLSKQ